MKLHLIMPMGGGGTRFGNKGFNLPKPLIEIYGKPFFYWATQSVCKFVEVESLTFVVLQDHIERFQIDQRIREFYPKACIQILPKVLNGAVLTCLEGCKEIPEGEPILFNDCDHLFICKEFNDFCNNQDFDKMDGALLTFQSKDPKYSFVAYDSDGYVTKTVEKVAISENAICGAYYFKEKGMFRAATETYLKECEYSEYFVSGVYNVLADRGQLIKSFLVDTHVSFGTPEEYDRAQSDLTYEELKE